MRVKIYQPTKSAMQSGKANNNLWRVEYVEEEGRFIDPLMGWTGNSDMRQELRMHFPTREEAIDYAKREGLEYSVQEPKSRKLILRSYAENFTKQPVKST